MIQKFRKKPVVIEVIKYTGKNEEEIAEFCSPNITGYGGKLTNKDYIDIQTLEGVMRASIGDWIIKGVKGEIYPCKPEIFTATYEEVK